MSRILVIEDNEDARDLLADLLAEKGYEVATAVDGLDGLEKLKKGGATVILLDLHMPRMDGWAFCQEKAKDPTLAPVPVVVVSAFGAYQALPKNIAAFLPKPIDIELMDSLLTRFAKKAEL